MRACLADDFAGIASFQLCQPWRVGGNQIGQPVDQLAALGGSHFCPWPGIECRMGRVHCAVHIRFARFRHIRPDLASGRIEAFKPRLALTEGTIDVKLETLHRFTPQRLA